MSSRDDVKRVLIVDDDELFREILLSILKDKDLEVLQSQNGKDALKVLESQKVDLIISDVRMPEMDGITLLKKVREKSKIPFILSTGFSEITETGKAHELGANAFLAKPFESKELLETVDKLLSGEDAITNLADEDFAKVGIDDFVSGKILKFNIFVRLAKDKYIKIAHEGIDLDINRVRSYKQRGLKYLYLKKSDFKEYLSTSLTLTKRMKSNQNIDPEKKGRFLKHTGALIVEKVLVDDLDQFAVEAAKEFFEASLDVIMDEEELFRSLEILNEHSDHLYSHSLGVSIYSIMIAKEIGWKSAPTTFRVGLAGLFHDIGLKEIDRKIVDTPRPSLERKDRMLYETHPSRTTEILSSCPSIPEEVIQAVSQHHEDPNGFGYPRGLKGKEILPLSRLLTVADIFCEYAIKNPDYPKGMSAEDAVDKMQQFKSEALEPLFFGALKSLVRKKSKQAA